MPVSSALSIDLTSCPPAGLQRSCPVRSPARRSNCTRQCLGRPVLHCRSSNPTAKYSRFCKSVVYAAAGGAASPGDFGVGAPAPQGGSSVPAPSKRSGSPLQDVFGGVTTAVVALPLALAFGVASGLGPLAGLYGSIFCGFFAAVLGGTPAQITGPTGPMTVVTAAIVARFAALGQKELVFSVVILAGVFQILLGILKLGSYVRLVPRPVTSGFMSGVGVIILSTQWLAVVGSVPTSSTWAAIQAAGTALANINQQAVAIGSISLLCALYTPKAIAKFVPGSLIGLLAGTATAYFGKLNVLTLGQIPAGLPVPRMPSFPVELLPTIVASALVLALLGGIDSLLTSLVADSLTGDFHDSEKELVGQGVGNIVSGAFGGVAGAGATVRTVVNVRAGGRTPLSGATHSVVLLCIVAGLGRFAQHIPQACLAGLLLKSGWEVLDLPYLARARQLPIESVFVMAVVLLMTVFVDLIAAVAVGVSLMSVLYVKDTAEVMMNNCNLVTSETDEGSKEFRQLLSPEEKDLVRRSHGTVAMFMLEGSFAFGAANGLLRKMVPALERFDTTILDLTDTDDMDDTAALAIEELMQQADTVGRRLFVCGATGLVQQTFAQLGMTKSLRQAPDTTREATLRAVVTPAAV